MEDLSPCLKCNCMTKSIKKARAVWLCEKCGEDKTLSDVYFNERVIKLEEQKWFSHTLKRGVSKTCPMVVMNDWTKKRKVYKNMENTNTKNTDWIKKENPKRIIYNKDNWRGMGVEELKRNLKNHTKLNSLLESEIIGFTNQEHMEIRNLLIKGEDLVKQVLIDKLEGVF